MSLVFPHGIRYLDGEAINKTPFTAIYSIDQLWLKYSQERFGFSAQKNIYEKICCTDNYEDGRWKEFLACVDWNLENPSLRFSTGAPHGHLPVIWDLTQVHHTSYPESEPTWEGALAKGYHLRNFSNPSDGLKWMDGCKESYRRNCEKWLVDESSMYVWGIVTALSQKFLHKDEYCVTLEMPDDLSSERNIDYSDLQNALKVGDWKEADVNTWRLMTKMLGMVYYPMFPDNPYYIGRYEPEFSNELLDNLLCVDLRTIDQLWVKYSNGRFGFSIQKRILRESNGDVKELIKNLGWDSYPVYRLYSAWKGHLPRCWVFRGRTSRDEYQQFSDAIETITRFFIRAEKCNVF